MNLAHLHLSSDDLSFHLADPLSFLVTVVALHVLPQPRSNIAHVDGLVGVAVGHG